VAGPDGTPVLDVVIVGAGMYGIAAASALMMKGIRRISLLDRAADGEEGPWITYARMETLRSPKHLPGVSLGIASLTFRAWYEARFGSAAWDALYKIPNADWQDYLTWVRRACYIKRYTNDSLRKARCFCQRAKRDGRHDSGLGRPGVVARPRGAHDGEHRFHSPSRA
jgi:cation diffusion facilitator CzcD-associated flavoprotein CzcO